MDILESNKLPEGRAWNHTFFHIDMKESYQETYKMKILRHNHVEGLLKVTGNGIEGGSRYTYYTEGMPSLEMVYEKREIQYEDMRKLTLEIIDIAYKVQEYMLSPDGLILNPKYIYAGQNGYSFCYLPANKKSFYDSFHQLTEFFVQKLNYEDEDAIHLGRILHKDTFTEEYNLAEILIKCEKESSERREEAEKRKADKKERDKRKGQFAGNAEDIFSAEGDAQTVYEVSADSMPIMEEKKYSLIKDVIRRIKTGYWGDWDDLITEINVKGNKRKPK